MTKRLKPSDYMSVPSFSFEIWMNIADHLWHSQMRSFLFLGTKFRMVYWSSVKGRDINFTPSTYDREDPSMKFVVPFLEKARSLRLNYKALCLLSSDNMIEGLEVIDRVCMHMDLPLFPCLRVVYCPFIPSTGFKKLVRGSSSVICVARTVSLVYGVSISSYFEAGAKFLLYASRQTSIEPDNIPDNIRNKVFNIDHVTSHRMVTVRSRLFSFDGASTCKKMNHYEWLWKAIVDHFREWGPILKVYNYFMQRSILERVAWMNIEGCSNAGREAFLDEIDRIAKE